MATQPKELLHSDYTGEGECDLDYRQAVDESLDAEVRGRNEMTVDELHEHHIIDEALLRAKDDMIARLQQEIARLNAENTLLKAYAKAKNEEVETLRELRKFDSNKGASRC